MEPFRERSRDATLHAHVQTGDGTLRHGLRVQVEAVDQALSAAARRHREHARAQNAHPTHTPEPRKGETKKKSQPGVRTHNPKNSFHSTRVASYSLNSLTAREL